MNADAFPAAVGIRAAPEVLAKVRAPAQTAVPPALAVVITCYNYQGYVGRAIRSVQSQGRDDCELVVIDDGSPDSSWEVISAAGVTAYKIRNSGARAACVFGLDQTRAPFVLFLDADDELKPGALEAIISRLDPQVAKLQFPLTRIDADGEVISGAAPALEDFRLREELVASVLRTGVYTSPPTSGNVFRRDLCEVLREATYDKFVDGAILFAAPFFGDVVSISEEIGCYRIHGKNDSGLGRLPDAAMIQRDIDRFVLRMDHLRRILDRKGIGDRLARPENMYFHLECSFYAEIARGNRPSPRRLPRLLAGAWRNTGSLKNKCAFTVFFVLATLLPNWRAQQLLAYRAKVGERSMRGFLNAMVSKTSSGDAA